MKNRGLSIAFFAVAVAVLAAAPASVFAQQVEAQANPLDSSSDISAWQTYGYPWPWAVDDTPIAGHNSAASLNVNNGSDVDNFDYWFYADVYSDPIDVSSENSPVLTFWCRYDLPDQADYQDRYIWMYDNNDYDPYVQLYFGADISCSAADQWHQHTIDLDALGLSSAPFILEFYIYWDWWSWGGSAAGYDGWFIDNIQILVPDVTPPDPISDLAAANPTLTEIEVAWSAPSDDDVSGVVASYDLRYSTSPITGTNFDSATQVTGEPAPDVAGTPHTLLVTGLTEDTTYYFGIRTTDLAGNVSLVSNVPSLATLAPPPPPPPPAPAGEGEPEDPREDDILPCSAATTAAPAGVLVLGGLIALAALGLALRK